MARPHACPDCGNRAFRKRYTTGGGWRVDSYVCTECGRRVRR